MQVLRSLRDREILKQEFNDKIQLCPKCDSSRLKFSTLCPHCTSPNIERWEVIEHLSCGCLQPEREFTGGEGEEYICPKCGQELKSIGVDYSKPGELYICLECDERFDQPDYQWRCQSCSSWFSL